MIDSYIDESISTPLFKCFNIDLLNIEVLASFFKTYQFDVIVHCAGISRQPYNSHGYETYRLANVQTTRNMATAAFKANQKTHFIFLSSVLVYGERLEKQPVTEDDPCHPPCDYSKSKYEAEQYLKKLSETNPSVTISILRLAQVYDQTYTDNLDKRVFLPRKLAYAKIGSGHQKMSALSRRNLKNFIGFLIDKQTENDHFPLLNIFNVTDRNAYSFAQIIQTFKTSDFQPDRITIYLPLWVLRFFLETAGFFLKTKKRWLRSSYNKLSLDFIYDNTKMLKIGFEPGSNLNAVFLDNPSKKTESG